MAHEHLTAAAVGPGADPRRRRHPTRPGHVGVIAGHTDSPAGRRLYLVQAPMTGIPVELTDVPEWAEQVVAVRHIG